MSSRYHRARSRSPPVSPTEAPTPPRQVPRRPHYYHIEPLLSRVDGGYIDPKTIAHDDDEPWFPHHPDDDDENGHICDLDHPTPSRVLRRLWVQSHRLRKFLSLLLLIYFFLKFLHTLWISPFLAEDGFWKLGLDKERGTFGVQASSNLAGVDMAAELNQNYLPGGDNDPAGKKRLVFVGDIHGCLDELKAYLAAVSFDPENDHLIHTGDVLAKGPDTPGVIDLLISLKASGVRGNWEDRVLTAAQSLSAQERFRPVQDIVAENNKGHRRTSKESAILATLKDEHIHYLAALPYALSIPPPTFPYAMPPEQDLHEYKKSTKPTTATHNARLKKPLRNPLFVVHAGLVPAVPLARQDPLAVTTMRFLHPTTHIPTPEKLKGSQPWTRGWAWYQSRLTRGIPRPRYARLDSDIDPSWGERWLAENGKDWEWRSLIPGRQRPPPRPVHATEDLLASLGWRKLARPAQHDLIDDPTVVVYGHNARAGVVLDPWTMGLDGGCVGGGRLTGFALDAWGRREVVSVQCADYLSEKEA